MRTKTLLFPLVALLFVGVITGCAPATPDPLTPASPGSAATPSPSGETIVPVDTETIAHHVAVTSTHIHVFNADNVAFESIHNGVTTDAVPVFTAAFGFEPTVSHIDGDSHSVGATAYDWSGFRYLIPDPGGYFQASTWYVRVTTAAVNGIPIYTGTDLQVGDPMSDAIAQQTAFLNEPDSGGFPGFYQAELLPQPVEPTSVGEDASVDTYLFVSVAGAAGGVGPIISFGAPSESWGL